MLKGQLYEAPDGTRGIDCNAPVTAHVAATLVTRGFKFVRRYVRRTQASPGNLTADEANIILAAGLGLAAVQHVKSASSWAPVAGDGKAYGETAASEAAIVGLPPGSMIACDLEGVTPGTDSQVVADYARAWHRAVSGAGFLPELYVGWHCGLTPAQLYDLPFARYWGAYNLDSDQEPAVRGICMKQHEATLADGNIGLPYDTDVTRTDAKGGRSVLFAPLGWAPENFAVSST
jgi:hypothetical protein